MDFLNKVHPRWTKYLASGSYIHENMVSNYKIGLKKLFILNLSFSFEICQVPVWKSYIHSKCRREIVVWIWSKLAKKLSFVKYAVRLHYIKVMWNYFWEYPFWSLACKPEAAIKRCCAKMLLSIFDHIFWKVLLKEFIF